eukprot:CFRG8378T1
MVQKKKLMLYEDDLLAGSDETDDELDASPTVAKKSVNDPVLDFDTLKKHGYTESEVLTETPEFLVALEKESAEEKRQAEIEEQEKERLAAIAEEEKVLTHEEAQKAAEQEQDREEAAAAKERLERTKKRLDIHQNKVETGDKLSAKERIKRQRTAGQSGKDNHRLMLSFKAE